MIDYVHADRASISFEHIQQKLFFLLGQNEPFVPSKGWADMIRKVYETYPLLCPKYEDKMRIIAFIEDHKVIDMIIAHLKLIFEAERPPLSQIVQQELLMTAEAVFN